MIPLLGKLAERSRPAVSVVSQIITCPSTRHGLEDKAHPELERVVIFKVSVVVIGHDIIGF